MLKYAFQIAPYFLSNFFWRILMFIAAIKPIVGRVDTASATQTVDLGSIPCQVKQRL